MLEGSPKLGQKELNKVDAEKRPERSEDLINFINKSNLYEFSQKIFSENLQEDISYEVFKDFLLRINGIARGIPTNSRHFDGLVMQISGDLDNALFLKYEDKSDVLEYAFESSKKMSKEDISYMLPAMINAVHYFGDGNGRTSRILRTFLEENESKNEFSEKLYHRLSEDGKDYIDINPGLIAYDLEKIVFKNHGWDIVGGDLENNLHKKYGTLSRVIEYDKII